MNSDKKLRIALAQMPVETLAVQANLERGAAMIVAAAGKQADLIVLPELWTTGFHWPKNAQMAQKHSAVLKQVAELAKENSIWVAGSLLSQNGAGHPANSALLFSPWGEIVGSYDKVHLFSMTGEDRYLEAGKQLVCLDSPWGKIGLTICYDLRFPELWRSLALAGAQLMLCPAGFPEPRKSHWTTLLRARAIENQCFVAGVNQTGTQSLAGGTALTYFGASCLYDPWGEPLLEGGPEEALLVADIDLERSDQIRSEMPVLRDRQSDVYGA